MAADSTSKSGIPADESKPKKSATAKAPAKKSAVKKTAADAAAKLKSAAAKTNKPREPKAPKKAAASAAAPLPVKPVAPVAAPEDSAPKVIVMKPPIIVKELAEKLGLKPFQVVHQLMEMNIFATLNQKIEEEVAVKICQAKGFKFEVERREKGAGVHKVEQVIEIPPKPVIQDLPKEATTTLPLRPPVVTVMGHVDHGKTSLIDAIRKTRVAAGEAGGITQHIGAYMVEHRDGQGVTHKITILDTPGHEAFTAMRARGTNVTDIAIILVAADDGIMPTTLEAISHAKAALAANPHHFAIMVAVNKIDLPGANLDRVKGQLQEKGLAPEDWGGTTICCPVSATKGVGINELMENILLQAEMLELRTDVQQSARGAVIESQIDVGRGPNATIIVQHGTLRVGDAFICGPYWGKVKALIDDQGNSIKSAGPSTPVRVLGFNGSPSPGEEFTVMRNEREARQVAEERTAADRMTKLGGGRAVTLENLFASIAEGQKKTLNVVLKTDVQGSLEAIVEALKKIPSEKVELNFILTAVGPVSVNDVLLAKASQAVIIGFGTKTDNSAATAAKREEVQIKLFSIIYELIDQVKEAMVGLLEPETRESHAGKATVKKVFDLTKYPVAGCLVESGRIARSGRARVLRKGQHIYDGAIQTLKRFQDDVSEVRAGMECGIRLGNFNDYLEGDTIECYVLEKIPQTL
ncbi:MAG: translation initiation factor IF-2 [Verrucomicrobiales bacterium]|jgi:translation initiation factor IF-2|nr:translation initiation factor IF-2 [Verrucomicrobiales bacterium]